MDPGGLEYIRPYLYCCGFSGVATRNLAIRCGDYKTP